jgi:ABC-type amino acid transport substrate-binding protein
MAASGKTGAPGLRAELGPRCDAGRPASGFFGILSMAAVGLVAYMVAAAVFPTQSAAEVRPSLVAASSNNFPPVNLLDGHGELTGFGRELSEAVVRAIGGDVRHIHSKNWTEVLDWLDNGRADFIHDTGYTPERTVFLDFSEPILEMPEGIFVLDHRYDIQSLPTLYGKRVACVNKHITHLYLQKFTQIECHVVATPAEGLQALLDEAVDAFIYPRQIVQHYTYRLDVALLLFIRARSSSIIPTGLMSPSRSRRSGSRFAP